MVDVKTVRLAGGAAAAIQAVQAVTPGGSFVAPGFSEPDFWQFWLPAVSAVAALRPGLLPRSKMLAGAGLAAVGIKRVVMDGQTALTLENAWKGYLPLIAGAYLLVR